jgi:hypothetical protein
MKSEVLRQQVESGKISSEQAKEELALYTASEYAALTESNPTEDQNQTIDNFSQKLIEAGEDVIEAGEDELISILVEKLVSALLGGTGPDVQPGPQTTMQSPSQ